MDDLVIKRSVIIPEATHAAIMTKIIDRGKECFGIEDLFAIYIYICILGIQCSWLHI